MPLGKIDTPLVREWRSKLMADGVSASATAKAYRFLRAVLMTATNEDHIVPRNPCQVRGADREKPAERPVLTIPEVLALAGAVPARYRAMILLTTFASLRFGEVTALERADIDLETATVRVRRSFVEVRGEGLVAGPPKSQAGLRRVAFPRAIADTMRQHLDEYVEPASMALVFTGPRGAPISRGNFRKLTGWKDVLASVGLVGVRFHDLRHTGNTLAARSGVSTRDLMARMGHDSIRAAIIYQHATTEADAKIAAALDAELGAEAVDVDSPDDDENGGTAGVLDPT